SVVKDTTDRSRSASPSANSTPADILNNRLAVGHRPIRIHVGNIKEPLLITEDDDIPTKCRAFLEAHNDLGVLSLVIKSAEDQRTAKITSRILKKTKKKKVSESSPLPE
ncbi:hypothetical protein MBANPS3_012666, partial [Mucor bainieri]